MNAEQPTYERQLQALGRILDRQPAPKEICLLQSGEGYVIHLLVGTDPLAGPAFAPATITVEAGELQAVMNDLAGPKRTGGPGWFNRR